MKFYKAINNNRIVNYEEAEIGINDFINNTIASGIARIGDEMFVTEEVLTNILNGDDGYSGMMLSWYSSTEIIQANFNDIFLKNNSEIIKNPPDVRKFCGPDEIKVLDVKYWNTSAEFEGQICSNIFIMKNELAEKSLFLCVETAYPSYLEDDIPTKPQSHWRY